jgi:membrane protease YdiL (CAAX protease family)
MSIKGHRALRRGAEPPTHKKYLVSGLISQAYFLFMALVTARMGYDEVHLFPPARFQWSYLGLGLLALVVMVGTFPIRRRWVSDDLKRRLDRRAPCTGAQFAQWALLAAAAGFCEEIAYRGVLFTILHHWLGGWWPAAVVASAVFALAHMIQGWVVVAVIFLFSLGFHGLVWYTGDLYTAMITHFIYDVVIGFILGFVIRPTPPSEPPHPVDPAGSLSAPDSRASAPIPPA